MPSNNPHARLLLWGRIVCAALGCWGPAIRSTPASDEQPLEWVQGSCPAWFTAEQRRLLEIAQQLEMPSAEAAVQSWTIPIRPDATVLYLPVPLENEASGSPPYNSFARAWNGARKKLADSVYAAALDAAQAGREETAYRLLWRTLRENPDHERARTALGAAPAGLRVEPRVLQGRAPEPHLGWPPRTYLRAVSPHFELLSRADRATTLQTAQRLERVYALWSQVFYRIWDRPGALAERLQDGAVAPTQRQRMRVYLLADRAAYLETLGVAEQNIGLSVGYYHPQRRMSFFYPAAGWEETLVHELTHQMFIEVAGGDPETGNHHGIWLVEGVALYMESLFSHGTYWTVGGIDAERVQTARYRGVRDGFWPAWAEFHAGGLDAWKQSPDVARFYSHAIGLTHVFLDRMGAATKRVFLDRLRATYHEGASTAPLLAVLGDDEPTARNRYQDLLVLQDDDIRMLHRIQARPQDLVACGSQLSPGTWNQVGEIAVKCQWLDLSFTNASDADLTWLDRLQHLRRLSLEGTRAGKRSIALAASLRQIEDLDLTGCPIDDDALLPLAHHPTLQTLWLGQTRIGPAALQTLRTIPRLTRCDLTRTAISQSEIDAFQQFLANRAQ